MNKNCYCPIWDTSYPKQWLLTTGKTCNKTCNTYYIIEKSQIMDSIFMTTLIK
jgi:hypothetical protein